MSTKAGHYVLHIYVLHVYVLHVVASAYVVSAFRRTIHAPYSDCQCTSRGIHAADWRATAF